MDNSDCLLGKLALRPVEWNLGEDGLVFSVMQILQLQTFTNQQYSFIARGRGKNAFASSFNYECLNWFFFF